MRCPTCRRSFATLPDEASPWQHECPHCGTGPESAGPRCEGCGEGPCTVPPLCASCWDLLEQAVIDAAPELSDEEVAARVAAMALRCTSDLRPL